MASGRFSWGENPGKCVEILQESLEILNSTVVAGFHTHFGAQLGISLRKITILDPHFQNFSPVGLEKRGRPGMCLEKCILGTPEIFKI